MTKLRLLAVLAVVALVLLPVVALGQVQPPQQPCRFYGNVTADGYQVAASTAIKAMIAGDVYQTTTPAQGYGPSSYAVKMTPGNKTYTAGEAVTFMIGDRAAQQSGNWTAGGNFQLNLTAGGPPQPTPPPGGGITGVQLGNHTGYDSKTGLVTIDKSAITGPAGAAGATGAAGAAGLPGKDAPGGIVIPIVALVLAVIAIIVAIVVFMRKPAKT